MTPQEKASYLVEKFKEYANNESITVGDENFASKECALICVNEIVETLRKNGDNYWSSDYWEQVKEAIESYIT